MYAAACKVGVHLIKTCVTSTCTVERFGDHLWKYPPSFFFPNISHWNKDVSQYIFGAAGGATTRETLPCGFSQSLWLCWVCNPAPGLQLLSDTQVVGKDERRRVRCQNESAKQQSRDGKDRLIDRFIGDRSVGEWMRAVCVKLKEEKGGETWVGSSPREWF